MEQKRRLRIVEKRWETPDTATFVLEPADGLSLDYRPGQFLSLIFQVNGREKRRAYSFSSSPAGDDPPAITVKRVVNGEFSNHLLAHANPGDLLEAAGPAGQFLLPQPLPRTLFYLAAGSGITPVMSHLKTLLALPSPPKIILLYANRDSRHTIFKDRLDRWMTKFPRRFECLYFFSREKNAAHARHGHLNNSTFSQLLLHYFGGRIGPRDRRDTFFFLCAPPPLMRMARMTLRVFDFPMENIRQEVFQAADGPPARPLDPDKTHRIIARNGRETVDFHIFEGETILNGALRQGIALPYTCKTGVCLTCLARCVRGEVDVAFAEASRREGPGGIVNTCIAYAVSGEVELRYD